MLKASGGILAGGGLVGTYLLPIRTHLRDIRLVNNMRERIRVYLRLAADGNTVQETSVELAPSEQTHLSCDWPQAAWSYEMAVKPSHISEWNTITWNGDGDRCKKIAIRETDDPGGPVSFFESPGCNSIETSCG